MEKSVSLAQKVQKDMIVALKAHDAEKTSTLRMMMTALKNKEIDKRADLTEAEEMQTLTTMVKQRHDSIEHPPALARASGCRSRD